MKTETIGELELITASKAFLEKPALIILLA